MGVRASSPASLDGIEFDSVKTKDEQLSAEVPEYATESGYTTSDDIIVKATTLTVTATIANRPVTWYGRHGSSANRVAEVTRQLRKLFVSRKLVTYIANGDTWENMALSGLKIPDDAESGDSVTVEFSLTQVTVTEKKTALVVVSFPRGGTTKTNAGSVSTKKTTSKTASSKSSSSSSSSSKGSSIAKGMLNRVSKLF